MIGRQTIALAFFVVLARVLGPETIGLLTLSLVLISLAELWVSEGLADVLVQRETIEDGHIDAAFWGMLVTSGIMAAGAAALAGPMASVMGNPAIRPLILALAPAIPLTALATVPSVILRRNFGFRTLAMRSNGSVAVGGAVGLVLALYGYGVWSLVAQQLVMRGVAAAIVWSGFTWRPGWRCRASHFRDLRRFSANILALQLLSFAGQRGVAFFIGLYLGPGIVGYYGLAVRCFDVLTAVIVTPVSRVSFSVFSRLQGDRERLGRALMTVTSMIVLVTVPAFVGAAIVSPHLVPVAFGARWVPAAPILALYLLYGLLLAPIMVTNAMIRGIGKPQWILRLAILAQAINIPGFIIFARFGPIWPVAVLMVSTGVAVPIYARLIRRATGLSGWQLVRNWAPTAAAAIVMAVGVMSWQRATSRWLDDASLLVGGVLLGVVLYAGAQLLFNRQQAQALLAEIGRIRRAKPEESGE